MSRTLPEFEAPPLHEVALSLQFEQLPGFNITHFGKLHEIFKDRFPHIETHAPLEPVVERFGAKRVFAPSGSLKMLSGAELPRVWFLEDRKTELLQIQNDRFVKNWRKLSGDGVYPRYENHIRPNFLKDLQAFKQFINENRLGEIIPIQCEVTYVNNIIPLEFITENPNALTHIFNIFGTDIENHLLSSIEGFSFKTSQVVDFDQETKARLIIDIDTQVIEPGKHVIKLVLVIRGSTSGNKEENILKFMDFGREIIVNSFDKLTSKDMHDVWGKKEA